MTAARIWTPDWFGRCAVCGCSDRSHTAGDVCPHTVDSITDEQVLEVWRRIAERQFLGTGVMLTDCLDASPLFQARFNEAGLYYPAPTWGEAQAARAKIVDVLNRERPGEQARPAGADRLQPGQSTEVGVPLLALAQAASDGHPLTTTDSRRLGVAVAGASARIEGLRYQHEQRQPDCREPAE